MKLFYAHTSTYDDLAKRFFVPSASRFFEMCRLQIPDKFNEACPSNMGLFMEHMQYTAKILCGIIRDNIGKTIAFGGVDTVFFKDPMPEVSLRLENADNVFAPDMPDGSRLSPEFMVVRCNENSLAYHQKVAFECMSATATSWHGKTNDVLYGNNKSIAKVSILPHNKFWNLEGSGRFQDWHPEHGDGTVFPPKDIIWFHADCTRGVLNKGKLLEIVVRKVGKHGYRRIVRFWVQGSASLEEHEPEWPYLEQLDCRQPNYRRVNRHLHNHRNEYGANRQGDCFRGRGSGCHSPVHNRQQ